MKEEEPTTTTEQEKTDDVLSVTDIIKQDKIQRENTQGYREVQKKLKEKEVDTTEDNFMGLPFHDGKKSLNFPGKMYPVTIKDKDTSKDSQENG